MQLLKIIIIISIISITTQACIKQVDVPLKNEKPMLVVEGYVTTDTVAYPVKLTYSGPITCSDIIPDQYLGKDVVVTITDDLGNSTPLLNKHQGVY